MAKRILVVDDEEILRSALMRYLDFLGYKQEAGYEITARGTAQEGLDFYRQEKPDMIFSDYDTGTGITGLDFLEAIRETGDKETGFCLMSGMLNDKNPEAVERVKSELGAHYLAKPFDLDDFEEICRKCLGEPPKP